MLCLDQQLLHGSGVCSKTGLYSDIGHYIESPKKIQVFVLGEQLLYVDQLKIEGSHDIIQPLLAPLPRLHSLQPKQEQSGGIKWYWYLLGGWFIINVVGGATAAK